MGKSRSCKAGTDTCKNVFKDTENAPQEKKGKYRGNNVYKNVKSNTTEVKPTENTVDAGARFVKTHSTKTGSDTDYDGKLTDEIRKKHGVKGGAVALDATTTGNTKSEKTTTIDTAYYKKRSKLGKKITGEHTRKLGGRIETEKDGKTETITYRGNGRRARIKTEDKPLVEQKKNTYIKAEAKADSKRGGRSKADVDHLKSMDFKSKRVKGDDINYELGSIGLDDGKQMKVSKPILKLKRKESTKVTKAALQKLRS